MLFLPLSPISLSLLPRMPPAAGGAMHRDDATRPQKLG
jgi:hypothetical protein